MSEEQSTSTAPPPETGVDATAENITDSPKPTQLQRPNPREVYKLPAPIRTFPLPAFNPSSPLSLLHLAYAWVKQIFFSPAPEPSVLHKGVWSPDAAAVIVSDPASIRALWEQGFFGKGHLSRSEPNWLRGEQVRLGLAEEHVSEIATMKRREERNTMKWERAKAELEAIRKTQLEEAQRAVEKAAVESVVADAVKDEAEDVLAQDSPASSRRPSTLLASDDSCPVALVEKVEEKIKEDWTFMMSGALPAPVEHAEIEKAIVKEIEATTGSLAPVGPLELLALPNSHAEAVLDTENQTSSAGSTPMAAAVSEKTTQLAQVELLDISQSQESGLSSPVGPLELLALPNSSSAIPRTTEVPTLVAPLETAVAPGVSSHELPLSAPIGPLELLALPNSSLPTKESKDLSPPAESIVPTIRSTPPSESSLEDVSEYDSPTRDSHEARPVAQVTTRKTVPNGSLASILDVGTSESSKTLVDGASTPQSPLTQNDASHPMSPPKSVRFSPEIKPTTFDFVNPPNLELENPNGKRQILTEPVTQLTPPPKRQKSEDATATAATSEDNGPPADLEHLQLTREEAFFLSFTLGVLSVHDPETDEPIPTMQLLDLFRRYSYMPPREGPSTEVLRPDDKFLTDYVVYHHFRALGWVPRPGIKFGVDLLLYIRGPVFDHAEYGVVVLPSYSDPAWAEDTGKKQGREKSWDWFHRTTRTLSHAVKTVVLAYVDVPTPAKFNEALERGGMAEAIGLYSVREIIAKRFNPNRNR